ncbi:hypothetical protein P4O66_014224 [Electrophorus voltai]|uniref:Uncharacterized protein n=1 Tax=Electrophorus voltai TaxID=2609070 RepID=A0AAD8YZS5_9TELE|nr:hypothetical protein P4O66_014224 [Electrophorus voltai]
MVTPITMTPATPVTPVTPSTPLTPMTPLSLSDLGCTPSGQLSRSTDLNSSISCTHSVNLNDDDDVGENGNGDDDGDDSEVCSSSLRFSSLSDATVTPCPPPVFSQTRLSKLLTSHSQEIPSSSVLDTPAYPPLIPTRDPPPRPSPPLQPCSDVGGDGAPSPCITELDSCFRPTSASPMESGSHWTPHHWPVLPPITPQMGSRHTGACLSSPCTHSLSDMFAELEDVAPRTGSCLSLDHPDCSDTGPTSPTTDLSPGLAALTVACDSSDLDSLSRVQLLLLQERRASEGPESLPWPEWKSPPEQWPNEESGLRVWSMGIPQQYQSTGTQPVI